MQIHIGGWGGEESIGKVNIGGMTRFGVWCAGAVGALLNGDISQTSLFYTISDGQ